MKELYEGKSLPIGRHPVEITVITESIDEASNESFFSCRFENYRGHIMCRFNNTERGLVQILKLFNSCGFHFDDISDKNLTLDTNDLLHKRLEINLEDQFFTNELADEFIEIRVITEFNKLVPMFSGRGNFYHEHLLFGIR